MKSRVKKKLTGDQMTYLNIAFIACTIREILDQYHTSWMPKDVKKVYEKIKSDANRLEMLADKKAGIEIIE